MMVTITDNTAVYANFELSSANAFCLGQAKILLFVNSFPNNKV